MGEVIENWLSNYEAVWDKIMGQSKKPKDLVKLKYLPKAKKMRLIREKGKVLYLGKNQ